MSNTDTKWEQALLNKVTSNGERIAVMERDIKDIKTSALKMEEDIAELKTDVAGLKTNMSSLDSRLSSVEKLINDVKKISMWIIGGIGAIIFSLIANFIYENFI